MFKFEYKRVPSVLIFTLQYFVKLKYSNRYYYYD